MQDNAEARVQILSARVKELEATDKSLSVTAPGISSGQLSDLPEVQQGIEGVSTSTALQISQAVDFPAIQVG